MRVPLWQSGLLVHAAVVPHTLGGRPFGHTPCTHKGAHVDCMGWHGAGPQVIPSAPMKVHMGLHGAAWGGIMQKIMGWVPAKGFDPEPGSLACPALFFIGPALLEPHSSTPQLTTWQRPPTAGNKGMHGAQSTQQGPGGQMWASTHLRPYIHTCLRGCSPGQIK